MDELIANIIHKADQLLDEDKPEQARSILADGLRKNPTSAPLWWALSQAMEKVEQESDCLERVLLFDPGHEQARRRLDELKTPLVPAPESTSIPEPEPAEEAFSSSSDFFQPVAFDEDQEISSAADLPAFDESASSDTAVNPSVQFLRRSEVPAWAEPPEEELENDVPQQGANKGRAWVMDAIIITTVLLAILLVVAYFWLRDIGMI